MPSVGEVKSPANPLSRRQFFTFGSAGLFHLDSAGSLRPMVVSVQVMYDRGAHSGRGLSDREIATFHAYQEKARRELAIYEHMSRRSAEEAQQASPEANTGAAP